MIRSPGFSSTPAPASITVPHTSWPGVNDPSFGASGYIPLHMKTSGRPTPTAPTSIRNVPFRGSGSALSISRRTSPGAPDPSTTQALMASSINHLM